MLEIIINKYKDRFKNFNKLNKKLLIITIFLFNLSIYSIPLYIYSYYPILPFSFLDFYTNFIYNILNSLNIKSTVYLNNIYVRNLDFVIEQQCVGFKGVLGLFSIIFSVPILDYKSKIKYFIITGIIIYLLNIVRILTVIWLYYNFYLSYSLTLYIHNVLWTFLTTISIILLWLPFYIKNRKNLVIN